MTDAYTRVAVDQLDGLEAGPNFELYDAVLDTVEVIFSAPGYAQSMSTAIRAVDGRVILRIPVPGHPPYKVFWTSDGPCIEAVFPHP